MNANEPVEVYVTKTLSDAEIVKNYLEGEGIKCIVEGENQASKSPRPRDPRRIENVQTVNRQAEGL